MSQYFPKPFGSFGGNINVKVDLSNYATKTDLKSVTHVDVSSFALKTNLANLKTEVDKLDIDKLAPVPFDLSKLSDVVKSYFVRNSAYNAKITEIENKIPDISNLAPKIGLINVEDKIPVASGLVKRTDYNTEVTKIKGKIPDTSNLAIKTALTAVENIIPHVSNFARTTALTNLSNTVPDITTLIKKSDYDAKIAEIESKYVSNTRFDSKLTQANFIAERNFDVKVIELENNIKKLQTFELF